MEVDVNVMFCHCDLSRLMLQNAHGIIKSWYLVTGTWYLVMLVPHNDTLSRSILA
jgi:hypothetical protein